MKSDYCQFPRCPHIRAVEYMSRGVCFGHWRDISESEGDREQSLLAKIGLKRDENRNVVELRKDGGAC